MIDIEHQSEVIDLSQKRVTETRELAYGRIIDIRQGLIEDNEMALRTLLGKDQTTEQKSQSIMTIMLGTLTFTESQQLDSYLKIREVA